MKTIFCRLCATEIGVQGIVRHLRQKHNVKFEEYLVKYLEDFKYLGWKNCKVCGKITKKIDTCSMKCVKIWKSNPENITGIRPGWNAGLTKETNETVAKGSRNRLGKGGFKGELNPAKRTEVREKISKTRIERGVAKGENNPMFGKTHTEDALRKIFDKRSMTKPEQKLKDILEELHITYTPQFFINTGTRTFSYDFYLPEYRTIIEVDGDYWHGGPGASQHWYGVDTTKETDTLKDDIARSRGYTVIRLWESTLNQDKSLIIDILQRLYT